MIKLEANQEVEAVAVGLHSFGQRGYPIVQTYVSKLYVILHSQLLERIILKFTFSSDALLNKCIS